MITINEYDFDLNNNLVSQLATAAHQFRKEHYKSPQCLFTGVKTLEALSLLQDGPEYYIKKDLLGRPSFIIHDSFVFDILITDLPYLDYQLAIIEDEGPEWNYNRVLQDAINRLNVVRNQILTDITMLSLHGEMKDVSQIPKSEGVHLNYYNLDDFKRVEDRNVRIFNEIWHFLDDRISEFEDDDL